MCHYVCNVNVVEGILTCKNKLYVKGHRNRLEMKYYRDKLTTIRVTILYYRQHSLPDAICYKYHSPTSDIQLIIPCLNALSRLHVFLHKRRKKNT